MKCFVVTVHLISTDIKFEKKVHLKLYIKACFFSKFAKMFPHMFYCFRHFHFRSKTVFLKIYIYDSYLRQSDLIKKITLFTINVSYILIDKMKLDKVST